jgi:hypothetical protein
LASVVDNDLFAAVVVGAEGETAAAVVGAPVVVAAAVAVEAPAVERL